VAEDDFERLLEAMPRIADAVKALPSELREAAYSDLVAAFKGMPEPVVVTADVSSISDEGTGDDEGDGPNGDQPSTQKKPARKIATRKTLARKTWTPDRHINFWPDDKQSFEEFIAQKQPSTIDQKNLASVFWLEQVAELEEISVSQVLAAYKSKDWHEPSYPDNALQVTASREHWLDTRNMKKITTTPSGRNMIKQMPVSKAKK